MCFLYKQKVELKLNGNFIMELETILSALLITFIISAFIGVKNFILKAF